MSCVEPILEDIFFESEVVVRAKILTKNSFSVLETFKGTAPQTYTWSTSESDLPKLGGDLSFKKGEEWILFGYKVDKRDFIDPKVQAKETDFVIEFDLDDCSGSERVTTEILKKLKEFKKGNFGCQESTYSVESSGFTFQVTAQKFPFKACSKNSLKVSDDKKRVLVDINNIGFVGEFNWKKKDYDYIPDLHIQGSTAVFHAEEGEEEFFRTYHTKYKKLRTLEKRNIGENAWALSKTGDFLVYAYSYNIYKVDLKSSRSKKVLQKDIEFGVKRIIGLSQDEKEVFYPIEEYDKDYKSTYKLMILNIKSKKLRFIILPANTTLAEEQLLHPHLDKIAIHTREFDKGKEYYKVHIVDISSSKISSAIDHFQMSKETLEWKKDGTIIKKPRKI